MYASSSGGAVPERSPVGVSASRSHAAHISSAPVRYNRDEGNAVDASSRTSRETSKR